MGMLWIGRLAAALLGTWLYVRLNAPDWRNRYNLFYDVPTLPIAFACAGELLCRFCPVNAGVQVFRRSGVQAFSCSEVKIFPADSLGYMRGAGIGIAALLVAVGGVCGAEYGS